MELETNKEELKNKTLNTLKRFWYVVLIVILFSAFIFMFWRNEENKKEMNSLKGQISINRTIEETEEKLDYMKRRETELYPKITKKYAELELVNKQIEKKRKELKEIEKERIRNEIQKMDINDINRLLNELGYKSSIISQ